MADRGCSINQPLGYGPSMLLLHHLLPISVLLKKKKSSVLIVRGENSHPVAQQRG